MVRIFECQQLEELVLMVYFVKQKIANLEKSKMIDLHVTYRKQQMVIHLEKKM